ncbi:hypothetical protein PAM7066_02473 [Palleronia marisminoris]|uniref:Uncharacterized protein n=1 Tax=Palleronia marisminoris TaxID=315423 RepID=A0A1Y5T0U7_9RHOB|nr:hypothetical protein PAM7066_02473 [Palleronia marisminoris]
MRPCIWSSSEKTFTTWIPFEVSCTTFMISAADACSLRMISRIWPRSLRMPKIATGPTTSAKIDRNGAW